MDGFLNVILYSSRSAIYTREEETERFVFSCSLGIAVAIIGSCIAKSSSDFYLCLMILRALLQYSSPPVLAIQHVHNGI